MVIIIISIIKQILDLFFYKYVYKLHIYLLSYPKYYEEIVYKIADRYNYFCSLCQRFDYFLIQISEVNHDLLGRYESLKSLMSPIEIPYPKLQIKLRALIINNVYLLKIFRLLRRMCALFERNISEILRNLPLFIVFLVFLIDLSNIQIQYTYYSLVIYLLTIYIAKVRKFYHIKDPCLDQLLHRYMVKKNIDVILEISENTKILYNYIINDYMVDYKVDNKKFMDEFEKRLRSLYMIVSISIATLFIMFLQSKLTLSMIIILTMPLAIIISLGIFLLWEPDKKAENSLFKLIRIIMMLIQSLILVIVYIKRKLIIFMDEVIWTYGIKITQEFTLEEKVKYVKDYLEYRMDMLNLNLVEKMYIIENWVKMDISNYIDKEVKISMLKEYIEKMIIVMLKMQSIYANNMVEIIRIVDIEEYKEDMEFYVFLILMVGLIVTFKDYYEALLQRQMGIKLIENPNIYKIFFKAIKKIYENYNE